MYELTEEKYIAVNSPAIAKCAIVFCLWHGKSPIETIRHSVSVAVADGNIHNAKFAQETFEKHLRKTVSSDKEFRTWAKIFREKCVTPAHWTLDVFIANELETDLTVSEIRHVIQSAML
jgi:hypothetical protein